MQTTNLSRIIRVGEVTQIMPEKHMVRVLFPEDDNSVSYELFVLCRNSFSNKDYNMPDLGEDVLCLFLPDGTEDGFVIGSFYAEDVPKPTSSQNERKVQFSDNTTVTYNRDSHSLDIVIENTQIHADRQKIVINTSESVTVQTKNANVIAASDISMQASGSIKLQAGVAITLNAPTISSN